MIFEQEYIIGNRDIGTNHKATNKAMLQFLENIACRHSDLAKHGINEIKDTKAVWILLDWKFKVIERPSYGQTIKVKTWSRKMEKCSAYRDFEIYDQNEKLLAIATTKWVLTNSETRKIQRIDKELSDNYESETEMHVFEEEIEKLQEPEIKDSSIQLKIRRSDIDINNHVNNLNYLDLAYEILPDEIYNKDIKNIRITYKHQTVFGETVNIFYTMQEEKSIVTIKTNDNTELHAIIQLW